MVWPVLRFLLLFTGLLGSCPVLAQAVPPVLVPGVVVDSLVVLTAGCADSGRVTTRLAVTRIQVLGNVRTKARVILAELDFREGDSLTLADLRRRLENNRQRVFNLRLFHAVLCQVTCRPGGMLVSFSVRERWYFFPAPIFSLADRNFRSWLAHADLRRLDYGLHLSHHNFRGRNERLVINLQQGFNRKYEVFYALPYFDRRRRLGLSTAASFVQSHSLDYLTVQDRPRTLRTNNAFPIRRWYVQGALLWRRTIVYQTRLGLTFSHERITDTVRQLNPRYLGGDLSPLSRANVEVALERTINHRDVFAYPLRGRYLNFAVRPRLGLTHGAPTTVSLYADVAGYWALGRQFYYAAELEAQSRLGGPVAYADNLAFGYQTGVRGYELYVVGGQHLAVVRQGLSRRLFAIDRLPLPVARGSRFGDIPAALYLNLFADAGLASDASVLVKGNALPNRLLGVVGLGLHLVTYYDRVLRLEATLNARGQRGFSLATGYPI